MIFLVYILNFLKLKKRNKWGEDKKTEKNQNQAQAIMEPRLHQWIEETDGRLKEWARRLECFYKQDQQRMELIIVRLNSQIRVLHQQLSELEGELCSLREQSITRNIDKGPS